MRRTFLAWTRKTVGVLLLGGCAAMAGRAVAQIPQPAEPTATRHFTNQTVFSLPIRIEEAARPSVREVLLLVKTPNEKWKQASSAPAAQNSFRYTVPADGEYWFTLVTVDNQGVCNPKDVEHIPDSDVVRVVVDTAPPSFDLKQVKLPSGEQGILCEVTDANPEPGAVKITYRGAGNVLQVLEPIGPGLYRLPNLDILNQPLQVTVADKAKNTVTRSIVVADNAVKQASVDEVMTPAKQGMVQSQGPLASKGAEPAIFPTTSNIEVDSHPAKTLHEQPEIKASQDGIQRQLINTTRASLEYRIDHVGPSGVGKVEVWYTSDQGATWRRLCEDADKRSPAEFDLPGDGVYGVRVAVANGNGFGGRPPVAGDPPHVWIEVDTIAPVVHLKEIDPITNGGPLEIQWTASDKNLTGSGINLYYAVRKEGPWQSIARGVKNDGRYKWAFPGDQGGQFFIRVEAVDQAGNVARADSASAVVLDMTEPRATVTGVTAVPSQPSPLRGN
jgi:hypothetical protein